MHQDYLQELFKNHRENALSHRYINNDHIVPLLQNLPEQFQVSEIGKSVNQEAIYKVQFGSGSKKLLFWSQMHGNESTTTKALFDLFNVFASDNSVVKQLLEACTIVVIPILNPDGARAYTRLNANEIDLNRDAQDLSQPESKVLRELFNAFKPDFCFNLHGQRTIFNVGDTNKPATASFLAPAQDIKTTITPTRRKAMEVIVAINNNLQSVIPEQVAIYNDAFNLNCVGDTFQSLNVPTILFEAGHYKRDYSRDTTREFMFQSLLVAIHYIATNPVSGEGYEPYLEIPQNNKRFCDVIIRNAVFTNYGEERIKDIAIQYQEVLTDTTIEFKPKVEKIANLQKYVAHKEIDANKYTVLTTKFEEITLAYENDFVLINNELFSLK